MVTLATYYTEGAFPTTSTIKCTLFLFVPWQSNLSKHRKVGKNMDREQQRDDGCGWGGNREASPSVPRGRCRHPYHPINTMPIFSSSYSNSTELARLPLHSLCLSLCKFHPSFVTWSIGGSEAMLLLRMYVGGAFNLERKILLPTAYVPRSLSHVGVENDVTTGRWV